MRNALLLLRAEAAIGTEVAVDAGLRLENPARNAFSGGSDAIARFDQLDFCPGRDDGNILFQVVEDKNAHFVSPLFLSGDRVKRELQALVGVFLIASLARFVVDDSNRSIGPAVDAVDASDDGSLTDVNFKRLLGVQYVGRSNLSSGGEKIA